MTRLKVKDHESLERDNFSKAVLNVDSSAYSLAQSRKKKMLKKERDMRELKHSLDSLRSEYADLRALVNTFINKQ